jgi:hypothetical protein
MTDGLITCAAAFLRNKGKNVITEKEFLMSISMDLHWMPYGDAQKVLAAMLTAGVLEKNGEYLKPSFDVAEVDVPVAYRPSRELIASAGSKTSVPAKQQPAKQQKSADVFPMLMTEAVEAGMEKRDFISECNVVQKKLNIDIAAAGLLVLRDRGVDIGPFVERTYESVMKK